MNIVGLVVSLPRRSSAMAVRVGLAAAGLLRAAEQVPILLLRVEAIVDGVEALLFQVQETTLAVGEVVMQVDGVRAEAARVVGEVDAVQQRAARLVAAIEPLVSVISKTDVALVEELGVTVLPLLRDLRDSLPDLDKILAVVTRLEPVMTDVETRIAGLPGAGLMRKRGQREIEAAAADS